MALTASTRPGPDRAAQPQRWSPEGREFSFTVPGTRTNERDMMAARVQLAPTGFEGIGLQAYATQLLVVQNWFAELRRGRTESAP